MLFFQVTWVSADDPEIVGFSSGSLTLRGELFLPEGKGPFPVILYNHGSAPKMLNSQASAIIGPMFQKGMGIFYALSHRARS